MMFGRSRAIEQRMPRLVCLVLLLTTACAVNGDSFDAEVVADGVACSFDFTPPEGAAPNTMAEGVCLPADNALVVGGLLNSDYAPYLRANKSKCAGDAYCLPCAFPDGRRTGACDAEEAN
jgi:hypothetical protein